MEESINNDNNPLKSLKNLQEDLKKSNDPLVSAAQLDALKHLEAAYNSKDKKEAEKELTLFITAASADFGQEKLFNSDLTRMLESVIRNIERKLYPDEMERQKKLDELFDIWKD